MRLKQYWLIQAYGSPDDGYQVEVRHSLDGTTSGVESYEFSGSSSSIFQELLTFLDASIFTSLAIAEGVLPEGQLPLG